MLSPVTTSGFCGFDFFFLLLGEALACIIIGALYIHDYCHHDLATWLIVFGSLCLALWFFQRGYVDSYWGYYNGNGGIGFVGILALATLAIGIYTSVITFELGIPYCDCCPHTLQMGAFVLMIIFCVVAGLIVLQIVTNYRTKGVFIRQRNVTVAGPVPVVRVNIV